MSHPVITDTGRGDPTRASSVVKALAEAGRATSPGRSIKRMLQLRYAPYLHRVGGTCGGRASAKVAKAESAMKASSNAVARTTGVRTTAWGAGIGRANWGGGRLSADSVQHAVAKHVAAGQLVCPSLAKKRVTPHVLRHTAAMELLPAGVERSLIAIWFGHEVIDSTQPYPPLKQPMRLDRKSVV